ncbi:hypothetical protein K470DRAFT_179530 [Piedraia hortae CBS 480.64]|uniref:Uncharacterized protein n=1 Tax=Piedraia hortae CBS 480.64 TaxID=1314780 RepID=A0A6A7BPK3_9PEZI|nr:hypothetical protein K470DRAFT_179530 [Piedraia hortae CBS 480.64]
MDAPFFRGRLPAIECFLGETYSSYSIGSIEHYNEVEFFLKGLRVIKNYFQAHWENLRDRFARIPEGFSHEDVDLFSGLWCAFEFSEDSDNNVQAFNDVEDLLMRGERALGQDTPVGAETLLNSAAEKLRKQLEFLNNSDASVRVYEAAYAKAQRQQMVQLQDMMADMNLARNQINWAQELEETMAQLNISR